MGLVRYASSNSPLASSLVSVGQETFPRELISGSATMTSGVVRLTYFTARRSETLSTAQVISGTAAGATPTLVRMGLYSVAANGNLTLVASTPNDTTLLSAGSTPYSKAFSTPVAVVQGSRYAFALLVVTGAAIPTVSGGTLGGAGTLSALAPRITGQHSGQTDLQASIVAATLTDSTHRPFALLT